ncbi:MAG TPA: cupin domain-containing protein [Pirellulaceae bacterium]|nr:cupin domain-containing protein [Pirellulaceae bacterium]
MKIANLLTALPDATNAERFEPLLTQANWRLERITSLGQTTPPGEWLEQACAEWVLLLAGAAQLRFAGEEPQSLQPGDSVLIPAHQQHRVEWTDPARPTLWLALHYQADAAD